MRERDTGKASKELARRMTIGNDDTWKRNKPDKMSGH